MRCIGILPGPRRRLLALLVVGLLAACAAGPRAIDAAANGPPPMLCERVGQTSWSLVVDRCEDQRATCYVTSAGGISCLPLLPPAPR
jgi:hypothetical protein